MQFSLYDVKINAKGSEWISSMKNILLFHHILKVPLKMYKGYILTILNETISLFIVLVFILTKKVRVFYNT